MRKNLIPLAALAFVGVGLFACKGTTTVANAKKPLCWYNRQPSNSTTGVLDTASLSFNSQTFYAGFDAAGGGTVQGQMILDYVTKNIAKIDRNSDGTIGYVLAVGDNGHNDSKARTLGVRTALGTVNAAKSTDAGAANTVEGSLTIGGKTYKTKELASMEMKTATGSTWDATTAGNTIPTWGSSYGTAIDLVLSNNDGMAMAMYSAYSKKEKIPTFGYDANEDAVAALKEKDSTYCGTVTQHAEAQAFEVLETLRTCLDTPTAAEADWSTKGFSVADQYGNKCSTTINYKAADKSFYAPNEAITQDNYSKFGAATDVDTAIKQIPTTAKTFKVLVTIYNGSDNFLHSTYKPLLDKYAKLLNLTLTYIEGDGQTEASIVNSFVNLDKYDAYAINLVKTDDGPSYTAKLK
jgi:methyl-galactoside transport system substrate-binding protein